MANPVVWFEVMGKDGAKLRDFYSQLFDWELESAPGMDYGMIHGSEGGIGGGIGASEKQAPGVIIYTQVKDINAALQKAEQLGAKTIVPRTIIPGAVIFAQFTDPEGHPFGLIEEEG